MGKKAKPGIEPNVVTPTDLGNVKAEPQDTWHITYPTVCLSQHVVFVAFGCVLFAHVMKTCPGNTPPICLTNIYLNTCMYTP